MKALPTRSRLTWERIRAIPGLRRDLAVLLVLAVAGVGATGVIVARQHIVWPWEDRFEFWGEFAEAPGIAPGQGQEVRIAGVSVGDIVDADVTDDGRARLKLSVKEEYGEIFDNARLVLRPKSPLNEMYVEMDPGGAPGTRIAEGDVIRAAQTTRPVQLDEVLQNLGDAERDALSALLGEADVALARAGEQLPGALDAADRTLSELRPVVEGLRTRRGRIAELVGSLGAIAEAVGGDDARVASLVASARTTLDALGGQAAALDDSLAQLPAVTGSLRSAMGSVSELAGELDPALGSLEAASGELSGALGELSGTVARLESTVEQGRPVAAAARPVAADLRPLASAARAALEDLSVVTPRLDPVTALVVSYLDDVQALGRNTASMLGLEDANGGFARGDVIVGPATVAPVDNPLTPDSERGPN